MTTWGGGGGRRGEGLERGMLKEKMSPTRWCSNGVPLGGRGEGESLSPKPPHGEGESI